MSRRFTLRNKKTEDENEDEDEDEGCRQGRAPWITDLLFKVAVSLSPGSQTPTGMMKALPPYYLLPTTYD
jgi:hypothetical protein